MPAYLKGQSTEMKLQCFGLYWDQQKFHLAESGYVPFSTWFVEGLDNQMKEKLLNLFFSENKINNIKQQELKIENENNIRDNFYTKKYNNRFVSYDFPWSQMEYIKPTLEKKEVEEEKEQEYETIYSVVHGYGRDYIFSYRIRRAKVQTDKTLYQRILGEITETKVNEENKKQEISEKKETIIPNDVAEDDIIIK